jgi:hypothetical protein
MGVNQIIVKIVLAVPLVINHSGGHGSPPCYVFVDIEPCPLGQTLSFDRKDFPERFPNPYFYPVVSILSG